MKIDHVELSEQTRAFFQQTLQLLDASGIPFLLGGAYAVSHYAGVTRHTKDLDLFVRPRHYPAVLELLERHGYATEITFEDWLAKAICRDDYIDLIFSSRNRIAEVDDEWFEHGTQARIFDRDVRLAPPEETIWSKAFIMERDRFDGADVIHILRAQAERVDWQRLLRRFEPDWRVLYSHLVLFGFVYPSERSSIPQWVMEALTRRLIAEQDAPPPADKVCFGTMLSGRQYRPDVEAWGYRDAVEERGRGKEEV